MRKLAVSPSERWHVTVFSLKEPYLLRLKGIGLFIQSIKIFSQVKLFFAKLE